MSSAEAIATALIAAAPLYTDPVSLRTTPGAVWRKEPILLDKEEPPILVVTISDESETDHLWWRQDQQVGVDAVKYTAAYTLVSQGGVPAADNPTVRTWREQARGIMVASSTYQNSVVGYQNVDAGGKLPYPRKGLQATLIYTPVMARIEITETRPA